MKEISHGSTEDYLNDRRLKYKTADGLKEKVKTVGVAHPPGLHLWNVLNDALLKLGLLFGVTSEAYTHDVAVLITVRSAEETELILSVIMRRILEGTTEYSLPLALNKQYAHFTNKENYRNNHTIERMNRDRRKQDNVN